MCCLALWFCWCLMYCTVRCLIHGKPTNTKVCNLFNRIQRVECTKSDVNNLSYSCWVQKWLWRLAVWVVRCFTANFYWIYSCLGILDRYEEPCNYGKHSKKEIYIYWTNCLSNSYSWLLKTYFSYCQILCCICNVTRKVAFRMDKLTCLSNALTS